MRRIVGSRLAIANDLLALACPPCWDAERQEKGSVYDAMPAAHQLGPNVVTNLVTNW